MNKDVDYRSDFYSLGIVFYEMLCGAPPFKSKDTTKLIYAHIAKKPTPPHEVNPQIPLPVSKLILNMLAKNADERYQSTYGIKMDLRGCLEDLQTKGDIDNFDIGLHDVNSTFQIYQKLYGREKEIQILLNAFEEVSTGEVDSHLLLVSGMLQRMHKYFKLWMLLSLLLVVVLCYLLYYFSKIGYSGVGKTSLINEVHKPLLRDKGYFISGKQDQFTKGSPYSALIQAFKQLILTLLTESEESIQYWRDTLLGALGGRGQVMIDVIPEGKYGSESAQSLSSIN